MARTWTIITAALLALAMGAAPCPARQPFENQWGPFTGTVVDAATGQPIPGAVFTVIWVKEISFPFQAIERFFDARVAVADEHGRFEIPRRSRPFLFLGVVKPPYLSCIAPWHAPYQRVGAEDGPISVRLVPFLSAEDRKRVGSCGSFPGTIPHEKRLQFEQMINEKRRQMGLQPISFAAGGDIEKE
jgi:hypothetical protein